ncbi:MAG: glutamate formimidoyltransferase [Bacteroidia bacterium]|nr:glutamate formimidoyltransferase [Bacteroidia bacterium]
MRPLLECVPNFSEGRDARIIGQIADAIRSVSGVRLLEVDPGASTNRTVMTFAGPPDEVIEAAYQAIRTAAELIDMRRHQGEHPRMGATDVCPLVPLSGISWEEAIQYAQDLAARVGETLHIPVYLYERAATRPERRNLAHIRAGEYEGFASKIYLPEWKPDYGPQEFNARAGQTVIGVRDFLVAYNVNLNTRSVPRANSVAFDVREAGRVQLHNGKPVLDEAGQPVRIPGACKGVKAIGWYIEEYGIAQVSANLTDLEASPLHVVFDAVCESAQRRGLRVTGSELVGLIPKQPLLDAGRHFLRKQQVSAGVSEAELIHIAVKSLGLDELKPFDPKHKVIEYLIEDPAEQRLTRMPVRELADLTASEAPAPGGGSVAALAGAFGAALAAMVANLSAGKVGGLARVPEFSALAEQAQALKDRLLRLVDEDTAAFAQVMAAFRLPKDSPAAAEARDAAIQAAYAQAAQTPLQVMETAVQAYPLLLRLAQEGNPNAVTDAGTGALCLHAAVQGAALNVQVNLGSLRDPALAAALGARSAELQAGSQAASEAVAAAVQQQLLAQAK